ncbi:PREDICTED: uncharacterized protein LOC109207238 [Nicotiana attenuata]|uniref:C2 NT-type domain-containing protein n=1 Tax=Nicotiana attenuata TaxID=49451 RepID=A0A1J6J831_NICAT|nr:PREDICTED: uncharacterized protein LOC109207238 [Nicotiana attenuata]XP_019225675.1 PREDICTED: uncharacterized protein LOC109207238 [Nicotiana attenuata]XP_019225683.1 PREDICTED: uncharacterized protein LOC109207238 [Nicotiana attenuata]OIT05959.1 hypothetical protein A4A49_35077 [Nicotiana attenuata]
MISGLRAKTRKGPSVQVDYLIHIQEIKPWPPSQSLRTVRAILIQWEHGDRSGSTSQVVPSLGSGVGDGSIEFNESFKLPVTLLREISIKGGDGDTFQKNCIEFNLYEPRRDKTVKGQPLGTAIINLAEYGVVNKEGLNVSAPINCTRAYRNTVQPLIFLKIQQFDRSRASSSSRDELTRGASIDRTGIESVSTLTSEEYTEEAGIASFTDDDGSSHSSVASSSSANGSNCGSLPQGEEEAEGVKSNPGQNEDEHVLLYSKNKSADLDEKQVVKSLSNSKPSLPHSPTDLSSDLAWLSRKIGGNGSNKCANEITENTQNPYVITEHVEPVQQRERILANSESGGEISTQQCSDEERVSSHLDQVGFPISHVDESKSFMNSASHFSSSKNAENASTPVGNKLEDARAIVTENGSNEGENSETYQERRQECSANNRDNHQENEQVKEIVEEEESEDAMKNDSEESDVISAYTDSYGEKSSIQNNERLKHVKSVRSSAEPNRVNGSVKGNQLLAQDKQIRARGLANERKDRKAQSTDTSTNLLESKLHKLEQRVNMAEGELREAAAIEAGLYSVVAEHGSSKNKVHAPARRLSRFYFHAYKEDSPLKRGTAAKSAVSGLILVARACGNDVSRLTFWLSNSLVLRATIGKFQRQQYLPHSTETMLGNAISRDKKQISSPLKWESFSSNGIKDDFCESFGNWEDPRTFTRALQRTEAWIFSRIVESIWWQTLTPHMQSGAAKEIRESMSSLISNVHRRTASSDNEERGSFSSELWKKAFKDACERICPVRAGGHECGCLHFLSKLIMEQCVARLDVAMFNAILRESADEIPSDPISDPISDADVLPIPAGKASFGAGAQLKNTIGSWSRWLTDLFGIDDGESLKDIKGADKNEKDGSKELDTSAKAFYLLNALSDLMMLPKDMLLDRTIRKEVCPAFGPLLIRRVLNIFVPDEFCRDPIPEAVLGALHSEDPLEAEDDSVTNYPCVAAPVAYIPPPISLVTDMLGDISSYSQLTRSGSSLLKKSYTSDEELEQLDSPLSFIINDGPEASQSLAKPSWMTKGSGRQRYQLLREVWINSE